MLYTPFNSLDINAQRELVRKALSIIFSTTRGNMKMIRPLHIARVLAIYPHPAFLSVIKHILLEEMREVNVDGHKWRLVEIRKTSKGYKFLYRKVMQ
ncbi:MAG: hypothetical protein DRJ67_11075 [Thermoprotei archaeon]|nr:MAG: hypothetical protein DRJ67_11075 [Thermoprotei archaeon]